MQTHQAAEVFATLGMPSANDADPAEEMLAALAECARNVDFYRQLVQQLSPSVGGGMIPIPDPFGDDSDSPGIAPTRPTWVEGIAGPDHLGDAKPHVFVALYNAERDRLARMCALALKAGVEERRVRVAEHQAVTLEAVLRAVLLEFGHDLADGAVARRVAAHLRTLNRGVVDVQPID